jgi:membrane protease YdiL (CAAX protease family)
LIVAWIIGGMPEINTTLRVSHWKAGTWYFGGLSHSRSVGVALIYNALGNPGPGIGPGETTGSLLGTIIFSLFSGPIAEELGWRGFALPRLQSKYNALISSLILGVIWTFWHIPFFFTTGATQMSIPFPICWCWSLQSFIWPVYNNTQI